MSTRGDTSFSGAAVLDALRSSIRVLTLAMIVLGLLYLASGITVVAPNEVGLTFRFGKLLPGLHSPGLMFALPPPLDEVAKVPVKSVQEVALDLWMAPVNDGGMASLNPVNQPYTLTGDFNIIQGRFVARYQISDPASYLLRVKDHEAMRDSVLYSSLSRVLSKMPVEDVLTTRKDYIGQEAMTLAQKRCDDLGLGIQFLAFETREINPPKAVQDAFQAVVSAKVKAKTLIEESNTYAASSLPDAKAQSYRVQQEAASYAKGTVATAQGEASSFRALLARERTNPLLVQAQLYTEMLGVVMPRIKTTSVAPAGLGGTFHLFLDNQKGAAPAFPQPR